ncbi:phosphatidate cytidylyltransferase [Halarsenatibacter silvermanii]|uniref:Phosphatidate cytidylyltransferase n=1 Tax=Halarsenatibacter silvermanii TaxID=321763 RepID=A0A1G9LG73_9FIRM|nr:phosphatidate cytidylyltransferase [Halarsenatibacter silvermanii]SDL60948.1 phosphatidate cytidylyltransferase [Halarsenatibacter silvermanii]
MLIKRVGSGIAGISFLIAIVYAGSLPFFLLSALLTVVGAVEYHRLLPSKEDDNQLLLPALSLTFIFALYFSARLSSGLILAALVLFLSFFLLYILQIINFSYEGILLKLPVRFFGLIYLGGGFFFLSLLRDFSAAPLAQARALWFVLIATWASDTGAYFVGRALGRKKLAPKISPNKTIAGALGGLMLSLLLVSIYTLILGIFRPLWIPLAFLLAAVSILGDLFASCLKRDAGADDTGEIIPGHGGVLDRFDSLLFSAPSAYFLFLFLL